MARRPPLGGAVSLRCVFAGGVVFLCVLAVPVPPSVAADEAAGQDARIVTQMHESIAHLDLVVEALALDDPRRGASHAMALAKTGQQLKATDLRAIGIDPSRRAEFAGYCDAQSEVARSIARAAEARDGGAVVAGVAEMFDRACVACHANFRAKATARTPKAIFMRNLLRSMQATSLALAADDYSMLVREAREIATLAHVLAEPQVAEQILRPSTPEEHERQVQHLGRLAISATQIESAAFQRDAKRVTEAIRLTWERGCLPCHPSGSGPAQP